MAEGAPVRREFLSMPGEASGAGGGRRMAMAATASARRTVRVWLVDDNEAFRRPCASLLGKFQGVVCDRQFGAAEVLIAALQQAPGPDAILLDIELPGMNGVDAVPVIKSLSASTAALMYSTFNSPANEARARAAGACGFLAKHEPIESVVAALHEAVGRNSISQVT